MRNYSEYYIWNLDGMIHLLYHTLSISLTFESTHGIYSQRDFIPASDFSRLVHRPVENSPFSYAL